MFRPFVAFDMGPRPRARLVFPSEVRRRLSGLAVSVGNPCISQVPEALAVLCGRVGADALLARRRGLSQVPVVAVAANGVRHCRVLLQAPEASLRGEYFNKEGKGLS